MDKIATMLRKPPLLGIVLIVMLMCEKMLAHTYTGITIYGLPKPWTYIVPAFMGFVGIYLVLRGIGKDEVKGSLLGYMGGVLIWMSWFESGMPLLAHINKIDPVLPETGNVMAGMMGEHVLLEASGLFCIVLMFFLMLNKDVRCRMLVWIRRKAKVEVGKPTPGYRPMVARVAAFEYIFVTWFMYVLTLVLIDVRWTGLHHPVTYVGAVLISAWGIYLGWKLTKQREVGLSVRYAIGAVGVLWFVPEILALYELFYEFYLRVDLHPIAMTIVFILFVGSFTVLWKTPVNADTGRSEVK
ncbi:MAG: hypothetical protein V7711_17090 [Pseudomonadales bacterium]